jgi:hypothetical protein
VHWKNTSIKICWLDSMSDLVAEVVIKQWITEEITSKIYEGRCGRM